jgi:hypothetical protein
VVLLKQRELRIIQDHFILVKGKHFILMRSEIDGIAKGESDIPFSGSGGGFSSS